jgi:hypothetical protein
MYVRVPQKNDDELLGVFTINAYFRGKDLMYYCRSFSIFSKYISGAFTRGKLITTHRLMTYVQFHGLVHTKHLNAT